MTNEKLEKQVQILTRVVGNQSVMLHALKEKMQSIYNLRDSSDDPGFQVFEIVDNLNQWADECDQAVKFDFSEFRLCGDSIYETSYVMHAKCGGFINDVETITEAIVAAESHICPEKNS